MRSDAMLSRLNAQLHEIRLDLQAHWLRRQEGEALRRLGEAVAAGPDGRESADVARLVGELAANRERLDELTAEAAASLQADRTDLGAVAPWMRPVVIARGVAARAVLRHRRALGERALGPRYEALGALVVSDRPREGADVHAARASLAQLRLERDRRLASFGETAHPAWARHAAVESASLTRAILGQLRAALLPKAPAVAGLAVGWWIANTYTDSHVRSALRSVGIGSGGTHVVSGSTFKAMSFWLPLLAAAVCAYLGERIVRYYRACRARP
jgi:hypothetical protein